MKNKYATRNESLITEMEEITLNVDKANLMPISKGSLLSLDYYGMNQIKLA